ncbi:MAG: hypothetical protein ACREJO_07665 [Phycisphaerales bacterium]
MGPSLSNPFLPRELAAIDALLAVAESPSAHPRERRLAATKALDICERLRADPSSADVAPGSRPVSAAAAKPSAGHLSAASHPTLAATTPTSPPPLTQAQQRPTPAPASLPSSAITTPASAIIPDRSHTDDPFFTPLVAAPESTPAVPTATITTPAARRPHPELPRAA